MSRLPVKPGELQQCSDRKPELCPRTVRGNSSRSFCKIKAVEVWLFAPFLTSSISLKFFGCQSPSTVSYSSRGDRQLPSFPTSTSPTALTLVQLGRCSFQSLLLCTLDRGNAMGAVFTFLLRYGFQIRAAARNYKKPRASGPM